MKRLIAIVLFCVLVPCVYGETITYDESKYIGDVSNGVPHGYGTWIHPDGVKYLGEYKNGQIHGKGTMTLTDGRRYVGEFKDGKPWNSAEYDKDGNITAVYSNGNRLKPTSTTPSKRKKEEEKEVGRDR